MVRIALPLQAGIERKYLSWAESAGQTSSRPTTDHLTAATMTPTGRQVEPGQGAAANPGPELVLAWVDNTFHNLRQRKVEFAKLYDTIWFYDKF